MFTGSKEKNHQREFYRSSLNQEGVMEVIVVEAEEDLVVEEEAKSLATIVDS